jgi:excisionase family DNA binding protein
MLLRAEQEGGEVKGRNLDDLPPVLNARQVMDLLGIGRRTVYARLADGSIPSVKLGKRVLIPTSRLLDMLGIDGDEIQNESEARH